MGQWLDYAFGGHSCRLYFDGSMYVEELNALFVTDVHLGKGGQFRKEGIPTPISVHRFGLKRHEPPGSDFSKNCSFNEAVARRVHTELNTGKVLICGHLHPGATLKGRGRFRVKMKAFYFNSWIGILPAFGALTGHYSLGENGTYFGLAENHVVALGNWEE